jgi:hypothetical protein
MRKSASEKAVRRLASEIGATIKRDNANRMLTVRLNDKVQRFWQGSWTEVEIWLRKQIPQSQKRKV